MGFIMILLLPFRVMVSEIYNPTAFLENHIAEGVREGGTNTSEKCPL